MAGKPRPAWVCARSWMEIRTGFGSVEGRCHEPVGSSPRCQVSSQGEPFMFRLFACEPMDRQLDRGSRRRRGPIRRRGRLPLLECLETRITPSTTTATWTGRGSDSNWTTAVNWSGNTAPQSGDDLVFPSNAASFDAVDNFPAGTSFNSLTISGSGYSLSEAAGDSLS